MGSRAANTLLFQRTGAVTDVAANIAFAGALKGHPDIAQWQRNTRPHQLFLLQSQNLRSAHTLREAHIKYVHAPSIGPTLNLGYKEESDGNRFFFSLLGPLDDVIQNDQILLVNELDRSLHPLLVRKIVRAFAQGNSKS